MPLDITFTLSDQDLNHFQEIVDKAKNAMEGGAPEESVVTAAKQLIEDARAGELPAFIGSRLNKLEVVINMINDEEWQLSDDERSRVIGALIYFCDPEDLIPDHVPGFGFLDDAIYVEIIIRELAAEAATAPYGRLREIQKELQPVLRTWEASEASPHSLFEDNTEDEEVRAQLSGLIRVLETEADTREPREAARIRARREMLAKIRKLVPF